MISKKILGLDATPVSFFLYFTGTGIAFVHIILLNYPFSAHTLRLTSVIFYVSLKLFQIVLFYLMMLIWILKDIIQYEPIQYPTDTRRGGVCIYFQKSLPLRILDIYFLRDYMNFKMRIGGKGNFISLYRSPNQPGRL